MASNVNISTIAKLAGVSSTTVSHLINRSETIPISDEKRAKIMEAMRRTNYRPSAASSSLRRKSEPAAKAVFIFGSYTTCNPLSVSRNPMLVDLLSALDDRLSKDLELAVEIRRVADEDSKDAWNETIADASSIICYGRLDALLFDLSARRNIPLVVISETKELQTRSMDAPPPQSLDRVYWDAASHLDKAVEHLAARGRRRLAFVSSVCVEANNMHAPEAEAKLQEFKRLLDKDRGLSGELFCPPKFLPSFTDSYEARNAYEHMKKEDFRRFDAVVGHNDFVAQGIVWALQEQGLRPGGDILVCGEGDYPECRHSVPEFATVSYDKAILAGHVRDILKRRLADNRPQGAHILAPSHLIARENTERTRP